MAKNLALAAALLVAAMLTLQAATANTYTTTITTTVVDETNPGQHEQCRQQLQGRKFQSCQRYLQQGRQSEFEYEELINPRGGGGEQSGDLRQCCNEIRNVNEQCRCEAIRQAVREQQQEGGGYQGEGFQKVYERARNLPRRCQFTRPQQCQLSGIFV
ncbi:2S seed storage albumin protein-like [Henckelia pumila]|uniref:2S seed storage albumin protein-like n=1 Tax=Henckelia pumila TaxID=405737 RepID=UPI003C6E212D